MSGNKDDWIIKGVKGDFYICKSYIFKETYEKVKEWKEKRRIIIFDKKENKIIYDKPIGEYGCHHTNLKNIQILDCIEKNADYERKSLSAFETKKGKVK